MTDASAGVLEQYGRGAYIFYILWVICGGIVVMLPTDSDGLACALRTRALMLTCAHARSTQAHARTVRRKRTRAHLRRAETGAIRLPEVCLSGMAAALTGTQLLHVGDRGHVPAGARSPGADVAGVSPVPVQMWQG